MKSRANVSPLAAGKFFPPGSRRDFLKAAAAVSAAVSLPTMLSSCKAGDKIVGTPGPSGPPLTFDFSKGDTAYLQFVYAYKQVQTDLYVRAIAAFTGSDLTATEQALMIEIKNHETIQRDTLKAVLGADALAVTPTWGTLNFKQAADVVVTARKFEDVSIGLINGMLQHLFSPANIALLLEIQTVEARHSASLRDELVPKSGTSTGYSPDTFDPAYPLSGVAAVLQPLVVETLQLTNAPSGL